MLSGEVVDESIEAALPRGLGPAPLPIQRQQGLELRVIASDKRSVVGEIRRAGRAAAGGKRGAVVVGHERHVQRDFEPALLFAPFEIAGEPPAAQANRRCDITGAETATVARSEVIAQSAIAAVGAEF